MYRITIHFEQTKRNDKGEPLGGSGTIVVGDVESAAIGFTVVQFLADIGSRLIDLISHKD